MPKGYQNPTKRAMTEVDFGLLADVVCTAGIAQEIGRFVVQPGQGMSAGYGFRRAQHDAEGRWRAVLQSAPATAVRGLLRVWAYRPNGRPDRILNEARTESLAANNANDRSTWDPFAVVPYIVRHLGSIVLMLTVDVDDTVSAADSVLFIDMTEWEAV